MIFNEFFGLLLDLQVSIYSSFLQIGNLTESRNFSENIEIKLFYKNLLDLLALPRKYFK
tara:strand:+ start:3063 stop:3239 length:177 start_codon:yes stop_codon:yes gene_type:complete